jgi:hypothetical protein
MADAVQEDLKAAVRAAWALDRHRVFEALGITRDDDTSHL